MPCNCGDNNYTNTQCISCSGGSNDERSTQKKIWKQVRVPASLYSMNLAALNMPMTASIISGPIPSPLATAIFILVSFYSKKWV